MTSRIWGWGLVTLLEALFVMNAAAQLTGGSVVGRDRKSVV